MKTLITVFAAVLVIAILAWKLCFPQAATSLAIPALPQQWHDQVYSLDADEVIRLVAPPFSPQRATGFMSGGVAGQMMHLVRANGQVQPTSWTQSGTIRSALVHCVDLSNAELQIEPRAGAVVVDGDWVVREQTPDQRRMLALAHILQSATQGKIEIIWNPIYAYCVTVQGSWNPPQESPGEPKPLHFAPSATQETLAVVQGSPEDFLRLLQRNCGCRFLDETVGRPKTISWSDDMPGGVWNAPERKSILRTLESQTSLRFTESRRTIPIWRVRERTAAKHSGDSR